MILKPTEFYEILTLFLFLFSYIFSFVILFREETELVGFGVLNFIHAGLLLYMANSFLKREDSIFYLNLGMLFPCISLLVTGVFYFVSLTLVNSTLFGLETKFINTYGTPLHLSNRSLEKLNDMKILFVVLFVLFVVLDVFVVNFKPMLNFGFFTMLSQPNSTKLFYAFVAILSFTAIGLSCHQLVLANRFSKLKKKDLLR